MRIIEMFIVLNADILYLLVSYMSPKSYGCLTFYLGISSAGEKTQMLQPLE